MAEEPQTHYIPVEAGKWGQMVQLLGIYKRLVKGIPLPDHRTDINLLFKLEAFGEEDRLRMVSSLIKAAAEMSRLLAAEYVTDLQTLKDQRTDRTGDIVYKHFVADKLFAIGNLLYQVEVDARSIDYTASNLAKHCDE